MTVAGWRMMNGMTLDHARMSRRLTPVVAETMVIWNAVGA